MELEASKSPTTIDFHAERANENRLKLEAEKEGLFRKIETLLGHNERFDLNVWMRTFKDMAPFAAITILVSIVLLWYPANEYDVPVKNKLRNVTPVHIPLHEFAPRQAIDDDWYVDDEYPRLWRAIDDKGIPFDYDLHELKKWRAERNKLEDELLED